MNEKEEMQLEDLKSELLKAQVIAHELVENINNSSLKFSEKQILDTKMRIVCDYVKAEIKRIDFMLNEI